ncbi:MAG TPA: hypothetical protein VGK54_17720 [Chloroflexota bacterium]
MCTAAMEFGRASRLTFGLVALLLIIGACRSPAPEDSVVTGSASSVNQGPSSPVTPVAAGPHAELPPLAEFRTRAAINRVPAPAGTGLPNVAAVRIRQRGAVLVDVDLRVAGLDNLSWLNLAAAGRAEYARRVAEAVGAVAHEIWLTDSRHAYVAIQIWHRSTERRDLSGPEAGDTTCAQLQIRVDRWECQGPTTWAWLKLPPAAGSQESDWTPGQAALGSNLGS